MRADMPSRRVASATLSWNLISIPVAIYKGTDDDVGKIKRSLRANKTGNPIKYRHVDAVTGDEVSAGEQYKVVKLDDDTEVSLSDDEIQQVLNNEKHHAEIVHFVSRGAADMLWPDAYFQMRPIESRGKVDSGVLKAWSLLLDAMTKRDVFAIVRLAMRDRGAFYALFPDGRMVRVLPDAAVRADRPLPYEQSGVNELELAYDLIDAVAMSAVPTLEDDGVERLGRYLAEKAAGNTPTPDFVPLEERGQDLIELLTKSIEAEQKARM